jgi:hypothetical protein
LFAPQVGVGVDLDQGEAQRAVDFLTEAAHPFQFLSGRDDILSCRALRGEFEHRTAAGRGGPPEREQFVLGGERSGDGFAVHGAVGQGAR